MKVTININQLRVYYGQVYQALTQCDAKYRYVNEDFLQLRQFLLSLGAFYKA